MLRDPICGIYEGSTLAVETSEPSFGFPELSQPTRIVSLSRFIRKAVYLIALTHFELR
jgi:hypothetical protein